MSERTREAQITEVAFELCAPLSELSHGSLLLATYTARRVGWQIGLDRVALLGVSVLLPIAARPNDYVHEVILPAHRAGVIGDDTRNRWLAMADSALDSDPRSRVFFEAVNEGLGLWPLVRQRAERLAEAVKADCASIRVCRFDWPPVLEVEGATYRVFLPGEAREMATRALAIRLEMALLEDRLDAELDGLAGEVCPVHRERHDVARELASLRFDDGAELASAIECRFPLTERWLAGRSSDDAVIHDLPDGSTLVRLLPATTRK